MNKVVSLLGLSVLMLAALAAHALTVTPQPGVQDQTVVQSAFLGVVPAVRVTDSAGLPVAGAAVQFSVVPYTGNNGALFFTGDGFAFANDYFTTTDANGVATAGLGPFGYIAGASGVVATATVQGPIGPDSASATIPVSVVAGGATRFVVVSGSKQKVPAGTAFAQPWVARAVDAQGRPVPNAAVIFAATSDTTLPTVTFNGFSSVWARADANGIATSPIPVANLVQGKEEGFAATLNYGVSVADAFFDYTITQPPAGGGGGGGGGSGGGCGAQGKGNGNCGNGHGANHGK
jgi:hypothetical protein